MADGLPKPGNEYHREGYKMNFTKIALSETEYEEDRLEVLLETAKKFKIGFVELWLPQCLNGGRTFDDVKSLLQQYRIQAACISTWTQLNIPERTREKQDLILDSIRLAKFLGAKLVNTYSGHTEGKKLQTAIGEYVTRITPCLKEAEKQNITIVLENEFDVTGTDLTRRADDVLKLGKAINSPFFKLNFDPSNFYIAGEEPYPYAYEILKDHIAYVHLKDAAKQLKAGDLQKSGRMWQDASGSYVCVPFGQGALNFEGILNRLKHDRYEGFLTLEPHLAKEYLDEGIEKTLKYLERI
jgi:sugar phosphate isomerase/epimerase